MGEVLKMASDDTLRRAVCALDPLVALLALVHMTGDRQLLATYGPAFDDVPRDNFSPFSPRDVEKVSGDPVIVGEIRERLIAALKESGEPVLTQLDSALFKQMAELCLGFLPSLAALAMGREQGGFSKDEGAVEATKVPPKDFKVLVLGAGMTGIIAGIKLKAAGFDFQIVERNSEIGGTWVSNVYPNVAVDTPSVQYSLSFEQNSSWSKYYPRGDEYQRYLCGVTDKYRLRDRIDFNTTLKSCEWDDRRNLWVVTCVRDGEQVVYEANVVVSAFGFLNRPSIPNVPGLEKFKGTIVHSAHWNDSIVLEGKKAVVVGTGATAAQLATATSQRARHLTVVQRQPNYMMPDIRTTAEVDPDEKWALENIPFVTQWQRFQSLSSLMALERSPGQIDPEYRAATGGVSAANEGARLASIGYIKRKFHDRPDLVAKLTPDFPFFAKRPILDCGYYEALRRDNVDLVQGGLAAVEEDAVIISDGTRIECDVLLLATGWTLDYLKGYDVRGRDGVDLQGVWNPSPFAYKGMEVPGFPNFFVTSGPNCGLTASHTTLAEQQVHYIVETVKLMVEEDLSAVEVTEEACRAYNEEIDRRMEQTVFVSDKSGTAHGYYRHTSGKVVLAFPGINTELWALYRKPERADHRLKPRKTPELETA